MRRLLEDDVLASLLREVVARRKSCLAAADDHSLNAFHGLPPVCDAVHCRLGGLDVLRCRQDAQLPQEPGVIGDLPTLHDLAAGDTVDADAGQSDGKSGGGDTVEVTR